MSVPMTMVDESVLEQHNARRHRLSVTERAEYKRCRRRWDYGSKTRQNLTPLMTPRPALQLGRLVHQSLAEWVIHPEQNLDVWFMTFASQELKGVTDSYTQQVGAKPSDEELQSFYDNVGLGHAMMMNYQLRWGQPLPDKYKWVSPEQAVEIPIPGTERECPDCTNQYCRNCGGTGYDVTVDKMCLHCAPRRHCVTCLGTGQVESYLTGTFDGLVQDEYDQLFILEHKTYGMRPSPQGLDTNDQFLAYLWMASKLDIGRVGGILYDGMWKRIKPPAGKSIEDLFLRTTLHRSQPELDEFEQMLAEEALEMAGNPRLYTNRRWEGCYDCAFEKLCLSQSKGEDWEYVKATFYGPRS